MEYCLHNRMATYRHSLELISGSSWPRRQYTTLHSDRPPRTCYNWPNTLNTITVAAMYTAVVKYDQCNFPITKIAFTLTYTLSHIRKRTHTNKRTRTRARARAHTHTHTLTNTHETTYEGLLLPPFVSVEPHLYIHRWAHTYFIETWAVL